MQMAKLSILLALTLACAAARAADPIPDWVTQQAAAKVATYPDRVSLVVLFREEAVTLDPDGRRVMHERGAVRILQPGGERMELPMSPQLEEIMRSLGATLH